MRRFKSFGNGRYDEQDQRPLFQALQIYIVAFVWVIVLIIVFSTQGCAEKPKEVSRPKNAELKDLVIQQPTKISASDFHVVNRLIFAKGGRLETEGADLRIEANEIISDDGIIESFSADSTALPGKVGRNGGNIKITAKSGRGTLFIYGRGQNGGAGVSGAAGFTGKTGAAGGNAYATHLNVDVVCDCDRLANEIRQRIKNSGFVEVIFGNQQLYIQHLGHRCIQETGDGLPGEVGGAGSPGGDGGWGGDSARLYVELENPSSLQIKAYLNPGQGGAGGTGGQGGEGGRGGAPGNHNLDYFGNCRGATQGPNGPHGERGKAGRGQVPGNTHPMCLKLGSTSVGECEKFNKPRGGN